MVKLLLLEDDPGYREIIERVIRRNYSFAVTSVATERQAQEDLSRETFDLVLLDLNIEGRRCWETLRRVVGHPGKPVPIVFSCEDTRRNAEYAVSLGAYTFLSKPFNIARLKTTIDDALDAKRRGAQEAPEIPERGDDPPVTYAGGVGPRPTDAGTADRPGIASPAYPGTPAVPVAPCEREDRARNGSDDRFLQGIVKGFRNGAAVTGHPAYFRIRLKEEFERTLRYRRNLTLALLALKDPEEPERPLRAPHGGPAVAYVQETIRSAFRRTDISAPCGKNEFSMLMPETRSERVFTRISGLRDQLQKDLTAGEEETTGISVWVGMASLPAGPAAKPAIRHVRSPEEFLRMARLALYRARLNETSPVAIFNA